MPIFLVIAIGCLLSLGCSFKNAESPAPEVGPSEIKIQKAPEDWGLKLILNKTSFSEIPLKPLKNSHSVAADKDPGQYLGEILSLPSKVPDQLDFVLTNIKDPQIGAQEIRVFSRFNGTEEELKVSNAVLLPDANKNEEPTYQLEFLVEGFKHLFPLAESRHLDLKIEIGGKAQKTKDSDKDPVRSVQFSLRTPPTGIKFKRLTPREFQLEQTNGDQFRLIGTGIKTFGLIQVLEFTSSEDRPVEILLAQRNFGSLKSTIYQRTYKDLGCSAQVEEKVSTDINQGPFEFFPLSEKTTQLALERWTLKEAFPSALRIVINPKQKVYVGLFGTDFLSLDRIRQRNPLNSMSLEERDSTCHEECIETRVDCDEPPDYSGRDPSRNDSSFSVKAIPRNFRKLGIEGKKLAA